MAVLPPDPLFCLKSDMGCIHSICFKQELNDIDNTTYKTTLLAATENGFVYFWDLDTNRIKHKQLMGESIQAIHIWKNNLITQEKNGLIKLWIPNYDKNNLNELYKLSKNYNSIGGYCRSIIINDNLLIPQDNSTIDIINIETMIKLIRLIPHKNNLGYVMCLQMVPINNKLFILAGYETGDIILWDYLTSEPCGHIKLREYLTSITYDPINRRGIVGNSSNKLQIFTIDINYNLILKCELSIINSGCNIIKLRPDRKIFVSGGWDGRIRLFSWKSLRQLAVLDEHKKTITDVQFSNNIVKLWNSNIMAASGVDGIISLWNLYN